MSVLWILDRLAAICSTTRKVVLAQFFERDHERVLLWTACAVLAYERVTVLVAREVELSLHVQPSVAQLARTLVDDDFTNFLGVRPPGRFPLDNLVAIIAL